MQCISLLCKKLKYAKEKKGAPLGFILHLNTSSISEDSIRYSDTEGTSRSSEKIITGNNSAE